MDKIEQFKKAFFQECDELLGDLESRIMALRQEGSGAEPLHAAFRAIHTIKGGAGMFSFRRLVAFAHLFENVLDLMRSGRIAAGDAAIPTMLRAAGVLSDLVQAARSGEGLPESHDAEAAEQLTRLAGTGHAPAVRQDIKAESQAPIGRGSYRIDFRPKPQLLRRANEPLLIVRQLKELGNLAVTADLSQLPPFAGLDPTQAYLAWTFEIETEAGEAAIRQVFEFVEGDCDLTITALGAATAAPALAPAKPAAFAARQNRRVASIRVDLDRIDKLVNMVGEIAIVQAMISQQTDQRLAVSHPRLVQEISQLLQLTQTLQDSVMAIRAVPVGSLFARMPRLVRELAAATGKHILLQTTGEDTEIDKTVIEELGDPLLHMVRNAADHGIERPAERIASGKPAEGTIRLSAGQRGGQIVIEISDDGRGLDRDRIRQKAVEKKLVSGTSELSDDEIANLIFLPGFSTAEKVTDISGRGVGMDVVKRNIQKLGGRISFRSEAGRGSKLAITLPLTLAILPGMIVRAGRSDYVIPLPNIIECLQARPGQVKSLPEHGEVLHFRKSYIPLIRLGAVFNIAGAAFPVDPLIIVVDDENGNTLGLAVDEITGQQQVVIKSLRENLDPIAGLAGATVLGDGQVALILVLSELLDLHRNQKFGRFPLNLAGRQYALRTGAADRIGTAQ
jgi:two-component system, chemotaxis family, sensor kinase CheA